MERSPLSKVEAWARQEMQNAKPGPEQEFMGMVTHRVASLFLPEPPAAHQPARKPADKEVTMQDHNGLPVAGYKPQSAGAVDTVNQHKLQEERLLRHLEGLEQSGSADRRWLAIARTHFEQAYMALDRAVFQPGRVRLPEDAAPLPQKLERCAKKAGRDPGRCDPDYCYCGAEGSASTPDRK